MPAALPPLGTMIEIPGAALTADALALVSDFFAIGSNDLTMYTLAIDRSDERVAHLYNPLHPGVLRMIQFAAAAALRARAFRSASAARSPAIRASRRCCSDWASASCRWRQQHPSGQEADSRTESGRADAAPA